MNARPDETISLAELADEKYYPAGNENYLTKSPGGLVLVAINLRVNENQQIDHWERLFVLPEGYRTPKALSVCATLFSQPGGLLGFGALKQESNGEIWFVSGLSALDYATYIRGEMIYNVGQ